MSGWKLVEAVPEEPVEEVTNNNEQESHYHQKSRTSGEHERKCSSGMDTVTFFI
jgi:hypothetical protein